MIEVDTEKKIQMVKTILDDVYEIMITFQPILEEMIKSDEAKKYREDGTFTKAASLFGNIAKKCKELELYPLTEEFLKEMKN